MNGKRPNAAEKAWLDKITSLGCCVCYKDLGVFSPGEVHHTNGGSNHLETICLCPRHHRIPGKSYETLHGNRSRFIEKHGAEEELLEYTREVIG